MLGLGLPSLILAISSFIGGVAAALIFVGLFVLPNDNE